VILLINLGPNTFIHTLLIHNQLFKSTKLNVDALLYLLKFGVLALLRKRLLKLFDLITNLLRDFIQVV
jgi:hypothetical protein